MCFLVAPLHQHLPLTPMYSLEAPCCFTALRPLTFTPCEARTHNLGREQILLWCSSKKNGWIFNDVCCCFSWKNNEVWMTRLLILPVIFLDTKMITLSVRWFHHYLKQKNKNTIFHSGFLKSSSNCELSSILLRTQSTMRETHSITQVISGVKLYFIDQNVQKKLKK